MIRKVLVVALVWSTVFQLIPRTPQLVFADTTSTTAATTTTTSPSKRITGGSLALLQLSEQQFQLRFIYSLSGGGECMERNAFSETWYAPSGGQWSIADGNTYTGGSATSGFTGGLCGTSWDSGRVFNIWGLQPSTTYTVTVTGGYAGNMVTASRSVTTSGNGWQNSTTSTITSGSSTTNGSSTTTTTIDAPLYMARIDSNSIVIDVCVCSESFVRANPSRYPGTWVPMWMGVNGKNYAGLGWTYDPVAENFYPPTTTTTTTTTGPTLTSAPTLTSTPNPTSTLTVNSSAPSSSGVSNNSGNATSSTTTAVPNGEARATIGGVEVEAETTVGKNAVTVSVGEVKAEISNKGATDDSTNTEAQQGLVLSSGESADVSIDGLQPNSEVEVVIYSTPRNLGSLQVNEFGELVASIEIPSNMESGSHTLVLKGLDKFGKQIELKFGLVVYSPDAYIPVWVWFLIGLLFILLALSFVSRRSKKGVITT